MNRQSDGGAKVLVNAYADSNSSSSSKAEAAGRASKTKKSSVQSKNVPDSRCSETSSSAGGSGGFQSFFRWFRRDESRVLARSASGSAVTPELHDSRRSARPRQRSSERQQTDATNAAARVGSSGPTATNATEDTTTAGSGSIASRRSTSSRSSANAATSDSVSQSASNGTHSSSPSPGPVIDCNNLSKSSSCDSILSTATNGFAFVPPNCYEAVLAKGNLASRRTIQPGPYTDSYKRRCTELDRARELDRKYELTLRKKYRLFASLRESPARDRLDATLTRDSQRTVYTELSLPTATRTGGNKTSISSTLENGERGPVSGAGDYQNVGDPASRRHRRTVSDSSKDRRAGAYVHVKGKRRAPPPPPLSLDRCDTGSSSTSTLTRSCTPNYRTLSPGSTLSRKKRPAPAPPVSPTTPTLNEASSNTSLLEDREIKAIIEGRPLSLLAKERPIEPESPTLIMPLPFIRPLSPLPNIAEERAPPGGLTEEQKQQLIDNIRKVQAQPLKAPETPPTPTNNPDDPCDVMKMEEQFNRANGTRSPIHDYLYAEAMAKSNTAQTQSTQPQPPTSPISPRPWYKRPISGMRHQESSLPFKRDIILKTIDKRKHGKDGAADDLPEVGYCRNSMLHQESGGTRSGTGTSPSSSLTGGGVGKFNLFAKITEKSDDTKRRERDAEKRRSAIGIPSISELDREAAEIVHNEYRCNNGTQSLEVQQSADKQKSTKELISKFEATSVPVAGKVTVSSSFVARKDYFGVETPKVSSAGGGWSAGPSTPQTVTATAAISEKSTSTPTQPIVNGPQVQKQITPTGTTTTNGLPKAGSDKNLLGLWTCPYCTLENPNWRIICEACERIKPYDSKLSILEEPPLRPNHPLKRPIPEMKKMSPANTGASSSSTAVQNGDDVDKKTERVLKYFMPKPLAAPATNGTLLVGGVNGDDRASLVQRKPSYGHTKPLASPKMGVKSLMNRTAHQDGTAGAMYRNFNAIPESYNGGTAVNGGSNKFDDQKLKECHVNSGTVAPVAPLASPEPTNEKEDPVYGVLNKPYSSSKDRVNIEEIRNARIARFGTAVEPEQHDPPPPVAKEALPPKTKEQQDQEALEKEKERLREMIRAMNAKALAEKYPVVQKPPSNSNNSSNSLKRDSPLVQRKNGLTSGIPISTKSLSPVPVRKMGSPLLARKSPAPAITEEAVKNPVPTVDITPVSSSPNTGAIRKTSFPRRTSDGSDTKLPICTESKIINQENFQRGTIPQTVAEINQQPLPTTLVLTNDVQALHYEPMDEQQFARAAGTSGPSSIPRPSGVPLSPRLQDRHRKSLMEKQHQHDEKLKQLSVQLRSQQGVDRFRSTLLYSPNNISKTGTLALNKLLRNLEQAIGEGAHDRAAELAMDLAKMKVSLSVTRQSPGRPNSSSSGSLTDISLNVFIDDKVSHKGPIRMTLAAFATLAQLKAKLYNEYQIPVAVQRWRCDDQPLEDDARTLYDYGIQTSDRTLFVYIVQPPVPARDHKPPPLGQNFSSAEIKLLSVSSESDGEHSDTQNDETVLGAAALPSAAPRISLTKPKSDSVDTSANSEPGWACPMCTLINPLDRPGCAACSEARPAHLRPPSPPEQITVTPEDLTRYLDQQPPLAPGRKTKEPTTTVHVQLRSPPIETRNDLNRISSNRKSSDIFNILHDENKTIIPTGQQTAVVPPPVPKPRTSDLLRSEHIQVPEQSRIVMTASLATHRSPNITRSQYRGVDNFNPNSSGMVKPERPMITTASPIVRAVLLKGSSGDKAPAVRFGRNGLALPEDGSEVTPNHYTELVNLDNADLIANIEPFECPICFGAFQPYEGIVLRDCLHSFCKQCLISTIQYSEDAAIRCPYSDAVYSCESVIQQREIKALVSKELYEAHLAKSIQQAESTIDNTFHCRTPNCRGWCIYEDNVNQFKCPVCRIVNCLTCRVIHDGLDCKQYQDRMNSDCDTNLEARRTKAMLQEMIEQGEALNCPTCQVIVMKKWGCDWLKCSMCKTEICWVTRGHRWGPAGKGDTTGGCRCGVNGIKCHPKCNYCH
uniref:RanBP-type and C3HC4-type zinc finger-containing protein 1 n=1 Tax=Anopheles epiroticus TaxID=199890 RepID=A0A182PAN2_9DIPT